MATRHIHVDEISVWSWIAISAFVLITLSAILLGTSNNLRMASSLDPPTPPLAPPVFVSPEMIVDPRA